MPHRKFQGQPNPKAKKKQKGKGQNPRNQNMLARGRVRITDKNGNQFGGNIRIVDATRSVEFSPAPSKPLKDANISTCQMVNTFTSSSASIQAGTATGAPTIAAQASANTYFALAFNLYDLAQVANWTALFDQYRIDKVEVKFQSQGTNVDLHTYVTLNAENPAIWMVLDFDDNTTPTSLAQILEYDNVEVTESGSGFFATVYPSLTPSVYSAGAFSGYAVERAGWIDCANTAVPHYGLKGVIEALYPASTGNYSWTIEAKYFFSFRNVR
jgi:hypothetical protein